MHRARAGCAVADVQSAVGLLCGRPLFFEKIALRLISRRNAPRRRKFMMIERALLRSKVDVDRGASLFAPPLLSATLRWQASAAAVVSLTNTGPCT